MFKNFINIAIRSIKRNKIYALINVLGLTLGITSCILVFLTVKYELSFEEMHDKNNIYRVVREVKDSNGIEHNANVPYPLAAALREGIKEAPIVTGFHYSGEEQIQIGMDKSREEHILFADTAFFNVFNFGVVQGNPIKTLSEPNKALITEGLAAKLFGDDNPIGKTVKVGGAIDVQLEGILRDAPGNTHLQYQLVISYPSFVSEMAAGFDVEDWGVNLSGYSFALLPTDLPVDEYEQKMNILVEDFVNQDQESKQVTSFHLQPLSDLHFDERYGVGKFSSIESNQLLVLISIGIFIMLVACINFINLSTALAVKKSKEVGVRKVLGAGKGQVIAKFMGETFFLCLFSLLISLGLAEWIIPSYNNFFEKHIALGLFSNLENFLALLALLATVTVLSGLYPSIILANYQPAQVLKAKVLQSSRSSISLRQGLVTFQFIISQILIIGTIIVSSQLTYFEESPLGFEQDAIITAPIFERDSSLLVSLKQRLLTNRNIENVSFGVGVPTSNNNLGVTFRHTGYKGTTEADVNVKLADADYLETFGLKLVAGRWITEEDRLSPERELIINETMARMIGFENPSDAVGEMINLSINNITVPVTGVLEDFHLRSLHQAIEPMAIIDYPDLFFEAGIKISNSNISESLKFIEEQWATSFPEHLFNYEFLDKKIEALYREERRTLSLFQGFAAISIFIGCLGLFGLISFLHDTVLQFSYQETHN
ncbi:MAG: ABC transporter permease [Bacteroidota bacterium]